MLRERGTVLEVKNKIASIAIIRGKKCIGCKHCIMAQNGKYMLTYAYNQIGAKSGDKVIIISKKIDPVADGFLLFISPLLLFVIGYIIGSISGSIFIGIITGFLLSFSPFIYFKLNKKKYGMGVEKIIRKSEVGLL